MFKVIVFCCMLSLSFAINTKYLPPAISTTTNVINENKPRQTMITSQQQPIAPVEYQKNFYIFTAPAEERKVYQQPATTVYRRTQPVQQRKNVIIINAPASTQAIRTYTAPKAAPSTLTFGSTPVKTTQTYTGHQQNIVPIVSQTQQVRHQQPARKQQIVYQPQQPIVVKSSKPEVHFLKYRTSAEADQIQQRILQQLGFTEADINRSIASGNNVRKYNAGNVINLSSASAPAISINAKPISIQQQQQTNVNSVYLPPSQNSITTVSSNNEAIDKNYARNYLPPGKDVQLGSSYLPLV